MDRRPRIPSWHLERSDNPSVPDPISPAPDRAAPPEGRWSPVMRARPAPGMRRPSPVIEALPQLLSGDSAAGGQGAGETGDTGRSGRDKDLYLLRKILPGLRRTPREDARTFFFVRACVCREAAITAMSASPLEAPVVPSPAPRGMTDNPELGAALAWVSLSSRKGGASPLESDVWSNPGSSLPMWN